MRRVRFVTSGLAASLLLHGLLFTPLIWGGHHRQQRVPQAQGLSASGRSTNSPESMLVVFTDDSTEIHDRSRDEDLLADRLLLPSPPVLSMAHLQPSRVNLEPQEDQDDPAAAEASGDQAGHAMLFGRYMGQVSARVERAWVRPRSIPPTGSFACRVRITQDQRGNVQEVTLQQCTEDARWQISLVRAIEAASPFPAPPDPSVFSNLLTMEFDADPYVAGGNPEGFEPVAQRPAAQGGSGR